MRIHCIFGERAMPKLSVFGTRNTAVKETSKVSALLEPVLW